MQQKLCLWLVVAVLFGALAAGNPWLADGVADAEQRRGAPAPRAGGGRISPALDAGPLDAAGTAAWRRAEPAFQPGPPAVQPVALRASAPDALAPFPDASRRPMVRALEFDADGGPVWVLHDGRRYMPNPRVGDGEPAVVELRPALPEK